MTNSALINLALAVVLPGCAFDRINGNGHALEESRDLAPFDRVEVSAGLEVDVTLGPQSVLLSGDDNILPSVRTSVFDGLLTVEPVHDLEPQLPLSITVSAPVLTAASLMAGGRLRLSGIELDEFELSGHAGGTITASGRVEHLKAELTAGGDLDASRLVARAADIYGAAGGTMSITATDTIDGSVESGSLARVHGTPASRSVHTASGGEIVYLED